MKKTNQELYEMCMEVDNLCLQLNSMSYNKKEERDQFDKCVDKLDLIHKDLSGDVTVARTLKKLPKGYIQ